MVPEHINPSEFDKKADNRSKLAMREFVNTKEGYAFFSKYAKKDSQSGVSEITNAYIFKVKK